MKFKELNLNENILKVLETLSFNTATEVQTKVIPLVLKGKNVCVKSPTGSGKTHSCLLQIFNKIDPEINKVQAIIISPTRELARQIFTMASCFQEALGIKIMLLSSGTDRLRDKDSIVSQVPQLLIGTPGRIKDLAFDNAFFNITTASTVVMDEADMIFEEGFLDEVGLILSKLKENIQFLAFSASLPQSLLSFLNRYIRDLQYLDLSNKNITNSNVRHICYPTRNRDRITVLCNLIDAINPYICIVFVSKKDKLKEVYSGLNEKGYRCCMIHGDLSATERRTTMKRIQNGEYSIVVASDIAARGIDIEGVSEVINYDLPYEEEFYFHRAGRTGRNGASGTCYTLYDKDEINKLQSFYKKGVKFENIEYSNGEWKSLKDLFNKKRVHKDNPLNDKIRELVNKNKGQKVKPGYKKKQKFQIEKLKRQHRRSVIENDIKRQRLEKYKENSRNKREKGEI